MNDIERQLYKRLLMVDTIAIIISMVAGPLEHTALAIAGAVSAVVISLCLIGYGIYFWPRER